MAPDDFDLPAESLRTIKFSLVEGIAPELAGLGALAGAADRPHVYVEGTRHPTVDVAFEEIFFQDDRPFFADSDDQFPDLIKAKGITPNRFLMRIWSGNDLEVQDIAQATIVDLVIFSEDGKVHGWVIGQNLQRDVTRLHRPKHWGPETRRVENLHVVENQIRPATSHDLQLVESALSEALGDITPH